MELIADFSGDRLYDAVLELFALCCYLSAKFILVFLLGRGDRHAAASILSLVWMFHAHRSVAGTAIEK